MQNKNPQALLKGLQHYQRAKELRDAGLLPEAAKAFQQATALIPEHPGVLADYSALAESVPDWNAVEQIQRRLLALNGSEESRLRLANALYHLERIDESLPLARQVAEARPREPAALALYGACLHKVGRTSEALDLARRSVALMPTTNGAGLLMACLLETGQIPELDRVCEDAARRFPEDWQIRHLRASHLLLARNYARGFPDVAWLRYRSVRAVRLFNNIACDAWDGLPFEGRLLVAAEQGIGDEVLASSMFGDILALGQAAIIECDPRLLPAFRRSFPTLEFVARGEETLAALAGGQGTFRKVLAGDLPRFFRTSSASFPARTGWLLPDPARVAALRARYDARFGDRLRVGISWRSQRSFANATKSLPLDRFAPLLADPRMICMNLQYGDIDADVAALGELAGRLYRDPEVDPFNDIEGLLAQISVLDVVLSGSNTTVHLAGALGQRCWVLLPKHWPLLWYWGYEGETTPWYPSLRLLRSPEESGWDALFARVAGELQALPHIG